MIKKIKLLTLLFIPININAWSVQTKVINLDNNSQNYLKRDTTVYLGAVNPEEKLPKQLITKIHKLDPMVDTYDNINITEIGSNYAQFIIQKNEEMIKRICAFSRNYELYQSLVNATDLGVLDDDSEKNIIAQIKNKNPNLRNLEKDFNYKIIKVLQKGKKVYTLIIFYDKNNNKNMLTVGFNFKILKSIQAKIDNFGNHNYDIGMVNYLVHNYDKLKLAIAIKNKLYELYGIKQNQVKILKVNEKYQNKYFALCTSRKDYFTPNFFPINYSLNNDLRNIIINLNLRMFRSDTIHNLPSEDEIKAKLKSIYPEININKIHIDTENRTCSVLITPNDYNYYSGKIILFTEYLL